MQETVTYFRKNCPHCGKENNSRVLFVFSGLEAVKCRSCGMMYVNNPRFDTSMQPESADINRKPYFSHLQIVNLIKNCFKDCHNPLNIAEIGCGYGYLARILMNQDLNINYTGFESGKHRADFCIEHGINVVNSQFVENKEYYDVIILDNVIEHVLEPAQLLKSISSSLRKGGIAVIIVPNRLDIRRFKPKYWGNRDFWQIPDHINFFRYNDVVDMALHSGLKIKNFEFSTLPPPPRIIDLRTS